jgi:RNA polymerase sigma factor (sigma-70 family)
MSEPEAGSSPAEHGKRDHRAEWETALDAEIMNWVRAAGPNSGPADLLRATLLRDGCGDLMRLHQTDSLLPRLKFLLANTPTTPSTLPPAPSDWRESAGTLIYVSVKQSLKSFFDNAVFGDGPSRWQPDGRASVRTYFANKCLLTLKDVYLMDHKKRGTVEIPHAYIANERDETAGTFLYPISPEDPESRAVLADLIRQIGQEMTELERLIIWKKLSGKTNEEIARDLGMSRKAVADRLYRLRRRVGALSD